MSLNKEKYKGSIKILPDIHVADVNMIYVTETNRTAFEKASPMFLFEYKNNMFIGICHSFELQIFNDLNDLDHNFSKLVPGKLEFEILEELDPTYYLFNYDETMKGDLDEFSDYELELIKSWNREINLRKLLNK